MAQDEQVQTVESSTTGHTMISEDSPDPLRNLTDTQRDHWLSTGELPGSKKAAPSSTAKKKEDGDSTSKSASSSDAPTSEKTEVAAKKPAESAPAEEQQRREKPTGAEARIKELDSEVKTLRARLANLEKPKGEPGGEKKESSEAGKPEPAPNPEDFQTGEDYLKAAIRHGVTEELRVAEAKRAELTQKTENEKKATEVQKRLTDSFEQGRKTHADFDEKALAEDLPIVMNSTLDHWLMDPDMTPELRSEILYHYGTHREELLTLNKMTPYNATRELSRLESKLSKSPEKSESSSGKAESKPAAGEKAVTRAPAPGSEVGAKGSPTEDPRAKAISNGDVNSYFEIENRKELARSGGSRK